ncbi:unnamed protein product [Candidula unifasciata]|uniref:Uncharacterized protein n=1 Tax=Candidula unifasciata TaxID=100452 RepID=A0A8S3YQN3_9EUPU|nr:unnamed protein product [Candidula unifasciata]
MPTRYDPEIEIDLTDFVKRVFENDLDRADKFLTENELKMLLKEEEDEEEEESLRKSIVGYSSYPLYREVANMLNLWLKHKHCPVLDLPRFDGLDERSYREWRAASLKSVTPLLFGLETLWTSWTSLEIEFRVRDILMLLGLRGILDLLGIRKTAWNKNLLPPSRKSLVNSFTAKHHPKYELSVGARALSKHHHRDRSKSFWGNCTGSDSAKNEHAMKILNKILDNAVWINIYWLPHYSCIIEVRQNQGYGIRWSVDGSRFRGLLEPPMVNGHEVGWRH